MRFNFEDNIYEITELFEPNKNETLDIIAIFKVKFFQPISMTEEVELDAKDIDDIDGGESSDIEERYEFVDYFYGASNYEDDELGLKLEVEDIIRCKNI